MELIVVWVLMYHRCGMLEDDVCTWVPVPSCADCCPNGIPQPPGAGEFKCVQQFKWSTNERPNQR